MKIVCNRGDLVILICETFHVEDNWVCTYIISDFRDEAMWVLDQIIVEPRQLCGLILNGSFRKEILENRSF